MKHACMGEHRFSIVLVCLLIVTFGIHGSLVPKAHTAEETALEKTMLVLNDLVGLNVAAYNISNVHLINEYYLTLPKEVVDFRLTSNQGKLRASCSFVNNKLLQIYLTDYSGSVSFNQPTTNVLDMAKGFLERYQAYTGNSFYGELKSMLDTVTGTENIIKTMGNVKFEVSITHTHVTFMWTYTSNGVQATSKNLFLEYWDGLPKSFMDNWQFKTIGGEPKISSQEAIAIALKALRNFSYEINTDSGTVTISQFKIAQVDEAIRTSLSYQNYPENSTARGGDPLTLYPSWWVGIGFDKFYPGFVTGVTVSIWADTGEVSSIGPMVVSGPSIDESIYATDTTPPSIAVLSPENKTYTTNDILLKFNASEPVSWVDYSLDGQANVTITDRNATISGNITLTGLSEGSHSLKVYDADAYGSTANVGASETIYFTIAQKTEPEPQPETEPLPITWIVVAITITAAVGAALLIYFTKVKKTTGKVEQ